jgi:hypothetical protein
MFQAGVSGNPKGRVPGTRNKRTEEVFLRLEARGDLDPADLLSSIVTNQKESTELRVQAANMLMPYKYGKTVCSFDTRDRGSIQGARYETLLAL